MNSDETQPGHLQPSLAIKIATIVGAVVAVSAVAAMVTWVLVETNRWGNFRYGIFGLAWGVCARLFEISVRRGIKTNLASADDTANKQKIFGEQIVMLGVLRRLTYLELAASAILLVAEIIWR